MVTTIQVGEEQLKILMQEKLRYRTPYRTIIDGYSVLVERYNMRDKLDTIMVNLNKTRQDGRRKKKHGKNTVRQDK